MVAFEIGAISAFATTDVLDTNRDIMGWHFFATGIRQRAENHRIAHRGNQNNHDATPTINVEHQVSLSWDTDIRATFRFDGAEFDIPVGVGDLNPTSYFNIGDATNGGENNPYSGIIRGVKIYSDEAMTVVAHHWPMNEGSGTTFFDVVGGVDLEIDPAIGAWE